MANTLFKTCIRCDVRKEIRRFSKNERMPGGHINVCKACHLENTRMNKADRIHEANTVGDLMKGWGRI